MRDTSFDPEAIAADAVALAELPGGTGQEQLRAVLREIAHLTPGAARD